MTRKLKFSSQQIKIRNNADRVASIPYRQGTDQLEVLEIGMRPVAAILLRQG